MVQNFEDKSINALSVLILLYGSEI